MASCFIYYIQTGKIFKSYGETMQVSSTLTSTKFIWGSLISFDLHNIPKIAKKNQHYKTNDPYHSQKLPTYFCITIYPSPPINMKYWTMSSGGSNKCHHMGQSLWSTNENRLNFCWPFWKTLHHMHMYQSKMTFMLHKA
jgi:hypothetical protein